MAELEVKNTDTGIIFFVKVVPGSSRTALAGLLNGKLKVKVAAAPERGKANECLLNFLCKKLGLKKANLKILTGQTQPVKQIQVEGLAENVLLTKIGLG
jgi:hypothetical protein